MATIVNAYVIYNGTTGNFVGNDYITVSINCERLQSYSPRPVWLVREIAPGDGTTILYVPTFSPSSDQLLDPNTLPGLWCEVDGQDVMLDVQNQSVATFNAACNACCDEVPTIVASNYNGNVPAFEPLPINTFCIYSIDDGSAGAHDAFADRYVGLYIGYIRLRSNVSYTSHYQMTSYYTYSQLLKMMQEGDVLYQGACND